MKIIVKNDQSLKPNREYTYDEMAQREGIYTCTRARGLEEKWFIVKQITAGDWTGAYWKLKVALLFPDGEIMRISKDTKALYDRDGYRFVESDPITITISNEAD
jgi:hypothetical protein